MNVAEIELRNHLKKHGYSLTKPRVEVFTVLEGQEAVSMAELVTACKAQLDRATVYRTVGLFEEIGVVHRLQHGWKYKLELTDQFSRHHHHLNCTHCGAVISIEEDTIIEDRLHELALRYHFKDNDHQIEIRGLCQDCLKLS